MGGGDQGEEDLVDDLGEELVRGFTARAHHLVAEQVTASMGRSLHVSVATSQWTLTGYLLAMGMAMPLAQWVSERFGSKRVWLCCLGVFLVGSVLAGAAWDVASLIVFRLVQGAAAGVMWPLLTTMLTRAAGRDRLGRAAAIATMIVVVAPVFGPVVGGVIVTNLGWRWVFYVNPPICLVAMWLAWRMLPPDAASRAARPLDITGLALLSPGLAVLAAEPAGHSRDGTRRAVLNPSHPVD